tara:strand:- start:473 stop:1102 length:630 start_codon:yes stop_codon:yes gene_type:complete
MKFYDNAVAPSPRRVRMFIAEKGLDIETVEIDIRTGEQFTDEFRAKNPFCTVPVLELDDGSHLITTDGCYAWLEETYPDPPLLGRTVAERAHVADALQIVMFHGQMAVSETLRNSMEAMVDRGIIGPDNYAQIPALAERGRVRGGRFMSTLNDMIGDGGYVVGDAFTAADIDAFVYVTFAKWAEIEPEDGHTALKRWYEAVSARPSAAV